MRPLRALITAALLVAGASTAHAVVPIDSLNYNNASGLPLYNGLVLTVRGTVTCQDSLYSTVNTDVMIQDATGATDLYLSGGLATHHFAFGDSVEVTGTVTTFNGLTEIGLAGGSVTLLGAASVIPQPLVLTCAQVYNTYNLATHYEANQSKLIRINGVHLTSGSWPTTCSGANVTLGIADGSGSTTIFIDKDTPVCGSPNPGAPFDIVGMLRQYDTTNPYTTGYQIVPRYLSDVIPQCPGPQFTSPPTVTTFDSLGATIVWTTNVACTSTLYYGTTTGYGNSVNDPNASTSHSVSLSGLSPRTLYHMQAQATDVNGTCSSEDRVFLTAPSPGTPGAISIYFNESVDNTVAREGGPLAQGNVNIETQLVNLINSATVSVDAALYSFSLQNVTNALIAAKNRGCTVRFIQDAGNSTAHASQLGVAGIYWITSTYAGNHGSSAGFGIMHDKYVVVDAKAADKNLARVWSGSWNCSVSGQGDAQNAIVLQDWGLAQAYTLDFEQMWGGTGVTPNTVYSKMGSRKSDITPHRFRVGGIDVEAFMSPSDQTEANLIRYIQQAQHHQLFAMLTFTSDPLSLAMRAHRDSLGDAVFKVRGLFEPTQIDGASEWCKLDGQVSCTNYWSPRADVLQDPSTAFDLLHHKYTILDEGWPAAAIWTGSHNWSNAANTVNDENSIILHDRNLANVYYQEWFKRYVESGGVMAGVELGASSSGVMLAPAQPNPSRAETRFRFVLPENAARVSLAIYDLSGRRMRTVVAGALSAGPHEARWDGRGEDGARAPAGMYFARLDAGPRSVARKLVLAH